MPRDRPHKYRPAGGLMTEHRCQALSEEIAEAQQGRAGNLGVVVRWEGSWPPALGERLKASAASGRHGGWGIDRNGAAVKRKCATRNEVIPDRDETKSPRAGGVRQGL